MEGTGHLTHVVKLLLPRGARLQKCYMSVQSVFRASSPKITGFIPATNDDFVLVVSSNLHRMVNTPTNGIVVTYS